MTKRARPDYLKVLQAEPDPQQGLPGIPAREPEQRVENAAPGTLTAAETAVWEEILSDMPPDAARELNRQVFETLVRATVLYREAAAAVTKYGQVIKSPSGYPIQSPYVSIMNKQAQIVQRASEQLGLTHAARTRGKQPSRRPQKGNPFEGLKAIE